MEFNLETLAPGRGRGRAGEGILCAREDPLPHRRLEGLGGDSHRTDAAAEEGDRRCRPLRPPVQHGQDGCQDQEAPQVRTELPDFLKIRSYTRHISERSLQHS